MFKQRVLALALSVAAVTAVTTGCEFKVGNVDQTPPTSVPSMKTTKAPQDTSADTPQQTGDPSPNAQFSDADVTKEINGAVEVVDKYWSDHWSELFTGTYKAPAIKGVYNGDDPARFTCGGQPADKFNAYYCIPEDYLAWDFALMKAGYAQGDAFVYLVVAHEWGHAIQNRLQMNLVSTDKELQADCLAGAVLWGAQKDGTLTWEDGDTTEIGQSLSALADNTEWADPSSHGDAIERVSAFGKGRTQGVVGCLAKQST
ncbi:neutral zinc metallopeptidase [Actinocorallia longicatena]|uniref:Metalloprotease n=1 Tax=Actinocorallia longicatena TaxID=111803 RepID=A0ABP6QBY9_9ACTN